MILSRHEACDPDLAADPGLTPDGRARADARARSLVGRAPRVILHSPRRRARETAAVLAAVLRPAAVVCNEALREVHPTILAPAPPCGHPDLERAQRVLREVIHPGLEDPGVLVIGHRNLLGYLVRCLDASAPADLFSAYGTTVELTREAKDHAGSGDERWIAVPLC
jgi:broad specificity phosphatase PhoE